MQFQKVAQFECLRSTLQNIAQPLELSELSHNIFYQTIIQFVQFFVQSFPPMLSSSSIENIRMSWKFLLMPMGVIAPGSAQTGPSFRPPIDMSVNFPVHMSAESPSNISLNCFQIISKVLEIAIISIINKKIFLYSYYLL